MSEFYAGELHERFRKSDYGRHLEEQTRFNDFKPEWVGAELWCDTLGDDVNNLRHMPYTKGLAWEFCAQNRETKDTTRLLGLAAITHDWGEAVVGDIAMPSKTASDEDKEMVAWLDIAEDLLGIRGRELGAAVMPIIFGKGTELADRFRAIEYIGYTKTALKARHQADMLSFGVKTIESTRTEKEQLIGGLLSLHRAVELHTIPTVAEYSKKYEGVRYMF